MNSSSDHAPEESPPKHRRTKTVRLLQNCLLVIVSASVFLLCLEVLARLSGYGNLVVYQPDSHLFWRLRPNQSAVTKLGRRPIRINGKGTRGKDFELQKPTGVIRILSLGDSKTFGWGLEESETYSSLLEEILQKTAGDNRRVEVINAGVNGWSYAQMFLYLRDIGLQYNPDIVIVADANKWTQFSEDSSEEYRKAMMRKVWLKNLLRRSALYDYVVEKKLQVAYYKYRTRFMPVEPTEDAAGEGQQKPIDLFKEQISNMLSLIKQRDARGLLIYIPRKRDLRSPENHRTDILQVKKELSDVFRVPLVDMTGIFADAQRDLYFSGDGIHPTTEGNRLIAEALADKIVREVYEGDISNE